jgi:hypothetical protein
MNKDNAELILPPFLPPYLPPSIPALRDSLLPVHSRSRRRNCDRHLQRHWLLEGLGGGREGRRVSGGLLRVCVCVCVCV